MHVVTTKRRSGNKQYRAHLLMESFREGKRVRKRTIANLSALPDSAIDVLRRSLKGEALVPAGSLVQVVETVPHGHVLAVLGTLRRVGLDRIIDWIPSRQRDLVCAMVAQRVLGGGSKLSMLSLASATTLGEMCQVEDASHDALLGAMDWLLERQDAIERKLIRRHLDEDAGDAFVLIDLSSSYVTGTHCELAARGYSRDRKKGTEQVNYLLSCNSRGVPLAIDVFEGNTSDPKACQHAIARKAERFGARRLVWVGDRGMLKTAGIDALNELDQQFITALDSAAIRKLAEGGYLQLSLFDQTNLVEIVSPDYPGERLVCCRNPQLARERAHHREALLTATEGELAKVVKSVTSPRGRLRGKSAGEIGQKVGSVKNRYKMAKHFVLTVRKGHFSYERNQESIQREAKLDGVYVVRSNVDGVCGQALVRGYKQLKDVERAFRTFKAPDDLAIRPIYHRADRRVRTHVLLCMLAYYVHLHMREQLAPLLFDDDRPSSNIDPVAPARRSPEALAKPRDPTTLGPHSFPDLLTQLASLTVNRLRIADCPQLVNQLTEPNPLHTRAFELLQITPRMPQQRSTDPPNYAA